MSSRPGIAIVGMACRLPGANSVEELWHNLEHGVESIRRLTLEDLAAEGIPEQAWRDPAYVRAAAPIEGYDTFDPVRFGLSTREAELRAPQHRVFLECALEALEDSGHAPASFAGSIGIFAGISQVRYPWLHLYPNLDLLGTFGELSIQIANDPDYLPTFISYMLDLRGPSVNVNCACSTSLAAVHLGCQSLLSAECDMVIAGGVTVRLPHLAGYRYQTEGIVSPDGHCRVFDRDARGTVFGSGVGAVVLRRCADALRDGDRIRAVIRGSAVNNDGARKAGYTAPSVEGQSQVVQAALVAAGLTADRVGYVEAHGTGTLVGDPIEVRALTQAFRKTTDARGFCAIGSVKSNIGHPSAAAGVAGLIKAVLTLEHGRVPPSLHCSHANPHLRLEDSPFYVNTQLTAWPVGRSPRIAGVSAFGIGGTNAHVVLEQAPAPAASGSSRRWQLLPVSAASDSALVRATGRLAEHLRCHPEDTLADVAFTQAVGREALRHRVAVVAEGPGSAATALIAETATIGRGPARRREVVFAFPGQGVQHLHIARGLYEQEVVFRRELGRCAEMLKPLVGADLRELLYPSSGLPEAAEAALAETITAQPAIFAVEYALAAALMDLGIRPAAVIGHSVGEYAAACVAGVLDVEAAQRMVALRGQLMQAAPLGAMTAVVGGDEMVALARPPISVAAVNGESQVVLSGPMEAIVRLETELDRRGIAYQRLRTSHGFHSETMDGVVQPLVEIASRLPMGPPKIPFASTVLGDWAGDDVASPHYWGRQAREPVRWASALSRVLEDLPDAAIVEVGPGRSLSGLASGSSARTDGHVLVPLLTGADERRSYAIGLAQLWAAGVDLDWTAYYAGERRRRVPLPRYPFDRTRCWPSARQPPAVSASTTAPSPALHSAVPVWRQAPRAIGGSAPVANRPLLFAGVHPLAHTLLRQLQLAGTDVVVVQRGERFEAIDGSTFSVDPRREEDLVRLVAALTARGWIPDHVLHCWTLDALPANGDPPNLGLIGLVKALSRTARSPLHLSIVTRGVCAVLPEDVLIPANATLLGIARCLALESRLLSCSLADVGEVLAGAGTPLTEKLFRDRGPGAPAVAAYRGRHLWLPEFVEVQLPEVPIDGGPFRLGGTYLITGGLGAIGLAIASHLAENHQARLVLLGRGPLPPERLWDEWLSGHEPDDAASRRIRALRRLRLLGARVVTLTGDVADRAWLADALASAQRELGPINGVIHAAGVPGGGLLEIKEVEAAKAVMRPKIAGLEAITSILDPRALDFLVLCSSVMSVTGGFGQSDYCAANAYMDCVASSFDQDGSGARVISICWDAWREIGMAVQMAHAGVSPARAHELRRLETPAAGEVRLRPPATWMLDEHRIDGLPVLPATGHLDAVLTAFGCHALNQPLTLRDVVFVRPVTAPDGCAPALRLTQGADGRYELEQQETDGRWRVASQWSIERGAARLPRGRWAPAEIRGRCGQETEPGEGFIQLGPRFRCVRRIWRGDGEELALLELAAGYEAELIDHMLHPALLDRALAFGPGGLHGRYVPAGFRAVTIHARLPARLYSWLRPDPWAPGDATVTCTTVLMDESGFELCTVEGFLLRRLDRTPAAVRGGSSPASPPPELDHGLPTAMALDAFDRVLASFPGPQVVVTARPLSTVQDRVASHNVREVEAAATMPPTWRAAPPSAAPIYRPGDPVEAAVARIWTEAIGRAPFRSDEDFFDAGGSSVVGLQVLAQLRSHLRVELSMADLYEHPTPGGMAELLRHRQAAAGLSDPPI